MAMSRICVGLAGIWALFGLAPAIWMAIELAGPGLSGDRGFAVRAYAAAVLLHAPAMLLAFPLVSTAALGAALYAEEGNRRAWSLAALGLVVVAGLGVALSVPPGGAPATRSVIENEAIAAGIVILSAAGVVLAALGVPAARVSTLALGALGLVALASAGGLAWFGRHGGAGTILDDTWQVIAVQHAAGTALAIAALAVLTASDGALRARLAQAVSLWLGTSLLAGGLLMAFAAVQLGLWGMPRGHADYPDGLAPGHRLASLGYTIFGAALVASLVRLILTVRAPTQAERTLRTFD